jgi:hypothetical protein
LDAAVELLRRRAATIASGIERTVPAGAVAGVFAGGSVARESVWAATVDGVLEIYSDVDLYVVLARDRDAATVRAAAARVVAELPREADGAVFLRRDDVGVYPCSDLRAQPARPGTADLATHRVMISGDEAACAACLAGMPEQLPSGEALYLLENRAWDVWRTGVVDERSARLARVRSLKLSLDIAAAHAIVSGLPASLISDIARTIDRDEWAAVPAGVLERARKAVAAREDLARELASTPVADDDPIRLANAWREIAAATLGGGDGTTRLLDQRTHTGARFRNARQFVRVARRSGMTRAAALRAALKAATDDPVTTVRLYPMVGFLERAGHLTDEACARQHARIEAIVTALGVSGRDLDERAERAQQRTA